LTLLQVCQSFFDRIDGITLNAHIASMVTPAQCRAARGLLDWSQQDLAVHAGLGIVTVRQVEAGVTEPRRATLVVWRQAFERAGVDFIDENGGGPGVRLRKRQRLKQAK
jgi:transcriptional regulator with XRE-family HTH domain